MRVSSRWENLSFGHLTCFFAKQVTHTSSSPGTVSNEVREYEVMNQTESNRILLFSTVRYSRAVTVTFTLVADGAGHFQRHGRQDKQVKISKYKIKMARKDGQSPSFWFNDNLKPFRNFGGEGGGGKREGGRGHVFGVGGWEEGETEEGRRESEGGPVKTVRGNEWLCDVVGLTGDTKSSRVD